MVEQKQSAVQQLPAPIGNGNQQRSAHLGIVWPQVPGSHKAGHALAEAAYEGDASCITKHAGGVAEDDSLLAHAVQRRIAQVDGGDVHVKRRIVCIRPSHTVRSKCTYEIGNSSGGSSVRMCRA
jgi:hypothetical protein